MHSLLICKLIFKIFLFNFFFLFLKGTHSPCAVKKLLSLSETKVKTVKSSCSSSSSTVSAPLVQHGKFSTTTSSASIVSSTNGQISPIISPKTQKRSISSSQSLSKYQPNYIVPLSSESSSVSTIKLNGKFDTTTQNIVHANPILAATVSIDGDSGRASMASNIDSDQQYSPLFHNHKLHASSINDHSKPLFYSKLSNNEMHLNPKINNKYSSSTTMSKHNHGKLKKSKSQNEVYYCQDSLEEEDDDQISAV